MMPHYYISARIYLGLATLGVIMACPTAQAKVTEVRGAIYAHNVETNVSKNAGKEDGPDVQAEVLWDSPRWLGFAASPRPSAVISINTHGETSFAGVGLDWSFPIGERFSVDPYLGYVIHTGDPLENPYAPSDSERRAKFNAEELALGSRDLFRLGFAVSYRHNEKWTSSLVYEHLSHGHMLGGSKNQGLDNLGIRLGRTF
jgi:lipid A 3-O-deacylase